MEASHEIAEMNFFEKLINVFFAPRKTMESIDRKPLWVLPFIVVLVLITLFTALTINISLQEQLPKQRAAMEEKGMSTDQIDNAMEIGHKVGKIIGPISALIVSGIFTALMALIIWFVGNIVLGGLAPFKKVFTVYVYSTFISILGMFIKLPLIFQKKTMDINFSLASFFNPDNINKFMYSFLKSIEVFEVWRFFVLAIGFAVVYRFSMKKSAWTMFALFLIYAAIMTIIYSFQMGK
ncbi:MAG: YIP1 family protein [Calditrichaeota bacterium]|nr:YIP1 family protein [Calditrichota bacterium]